MSIMQMFMGGGVGRVAIALTVSSSTANYNIFTNRGGTYAAGRSDITLTINAGVNVYSTSIGTPGLTVGGFTTGDTVTIINNGTIAGKGGNGGGGGGESGGTALSTAFATSITNNGTVQGGGGGGNTGPGYYNCYCGNVFSTGGGGGGGGAGINIGSGGPGDPGNNVCGDAGSPGTYTTGGAGGYSYYGDGYGGHGGNRGAAGYTNPYGGAGAGGAAGSCTVGNAYITWTVTGTRYGPLN